MIKRGPDGSVNINIGKITVEHVDWITSSRRIIMNCLTNSNVFSSEIFTDRSLFKHGDYISDRSYRLKIFQLYPR